MRSHRIIRIILFLALVVGCTVQFIPEVDENRELLVVEGMITDQNRVNRVRLSRSMPIGTLFERKAVMDAVVTITDENGIVTALIEAPAGTYSTDSLQFRGRIGGRYSLNIKTNDAEYVTDYIEMQPVPQVNSLYYEKVLITAAKDSNDMEEGCKIYVDSYDPTGECLYFRWDYSETWEYRIPYNVVNKTCYVTERSDEILVKNTSMYSQARVSKYPVVFLTNKSDRLKEKYSILVNQYSLNESEYEFWENVRKISQNVGGLYDITPMAVSGNIRCTTNPEEVVLGYFSVSAVTEKRLFIDDTFLGLPLFYTYCATDTVVGMLPETGLNTDYWVIEDYSDEPLPFWVITTFRECADCTTRGTKERPPYWIGD
ncbi:MAG: DUF4249 domain-containing protein [Bacteroidales bacterium]|nr:DUF4249 domain-containing protein [Bacteroidales bacterium]